MLDAPSSIPRCDTMTTFIYCLDDDTEITVEYDFFPTQRMTRDHPGCEAHVEIVHISKNGVAFMPSDDDLSRIKEVAFNEWEADPL
jgi:hypothetical protein